MANNSKSASGSKKEYLFNFSDFIDELRNDEEKKSIVEDYEKYVLNGAKIEGDIKDQIWYKEYLSKFTPVPRYRVPEGSEDAFDWDLLFQLIAGSFSSSYRLAYYESVPDLIVNVGSEGQSVEKTISELWSFQVLRLFEIYCVELIGLEISSVEHADERLSIESEREMSIKRYFLLISPPSPVDIQDEPDNEEESSGSKKKYLFNFSDFIDELRNDEEKKSIVEDYEKYVLNGNRIEGDVQDQGWYNDYLSKFTPVPKYRVPEDLEDSFDWDLLFQLVAGNLSSNYSIFYNESIPDLVVWVESNGQSIEKKVADLWAFQILRLFEIYCTEQINLDSCAATNPNDKKAINRERNKQLRSYFSKTQKSPAVKKRRQPSKKVNSSNTIEPVFFYCSMESAYHILKSGKVFASDIRYMNDKEELFFGVDVMMAALDIIAEDKSGTFDEDLIRWLHEEYVNKQNKETFKKRFEKDDIYITCCSYEPNSLSQWRAYGDNGYGVCIKLDFNTTLGDSLSDGFYQGEVIYIDKPEIAKDQDGQKNGRWKSKWIKEVKLIEKYFLAMKAEYDQSIKQEPFGTGNFDISDELKRHLRFLKNASFHEEAEFRILCLNNKKYPVKIRPGKGYLIPYIELELGNVNNETSILEIITGPALDPEKAKRSFEEFFKVLKNDSDFKYDYSKVKISHSTIPYLP